MDEPQTTELGRPAPPTNGAVNLWRLSLDSTPAGIGADADERARADRMRSDIGRERFLASRAWLRVVLGHHLGVDPGAVRFAVAPRGKPSIVDGGDLCFSLSRSAEVGLIAITRGRAVGVDVERMRSDADHDRLAERFFAPAELDDLRRLAGHERREAFYRLWVRKEAVVKASGAGLGDGISHLDVRTSRVADRWSVAPLDIGPDFAAAVAVAGTMGRRRFRTLPSPKVEPCQKRSSRRSWPTMTSPPNEETPSSQ